MIIVPLSTKLLKSVLIRMVNIDLMLTVVTFVIRVCIDCPLLRSIILIKLINEKKEHVIDVVLSCRHRFITAKHVQPYCIKGNINMKSSTTKLGNLFTVYNIKTFANVFNGDSLSKDSCLLFQINEHANLLNLFDLV